MLRLQKAKVEAMNENHHMTPSATGTKAKRISFAATTNNQIQRCLEIYGELERAECSNALSKRH